MKASGERVKAILMIAYTYYDSDPRVIREAEAALAAGFRVDFLALRKPGTAAEEMVRGVRVIRVNQAKYRGGGRLKYLTDYLVYFFRCFLHTSVFYMKQRYSAIHVNNMPDFLVFSTIIPRLFGAKVILDIHDPMPNTFVSKFRLRNDGGFFYRLLLWQERLSAVYSSKVVTVHHPVRDGILLEHGIPAKSIEVIANFADERLFPLRKSFHVNGQVRLVFHGTILERSGLRTLVNGLAKVRNRDRVFLKIIGEGDFSETLKQLILSLGIGDKVEFDNQSYPVHSIAERFAECNVGVVPLEISSVTNYALPLKLLEYISLGLPVVSVRNEAISYYFKEEDCIFFDWNDPSSLSAALDRIAECPKMLMRYHQRAIELREQFGWAGEKAKYINLLRELTGAATK